MVVLDMPGSPLAWRSAGSADAPPAVFIHGLGGNRFSWEPQLSALADVRQCLACDLPGYGNSAGLPGSLPELAALAADWIASLGRGAADVVGLSFGGMVAQHLALNHPEAVRTLALLDTSPAFGFDGVTTPEEWLATRVSPAAGPSAADASAAGSSAPDTDKIIAGIVGPDCPAEVRDAAAAIMREVPPATLAASCRALVAHDTRGLLHQVAAPTLVMVGAADTETPESYARAIADRIPGARLVVIPKAGHLVNVEAPEAVNEELRRLWRSGTAEPSREVSP